MRVPLDKTPDERGASSFLFDQRRYLIDYVGTRGKKHLVEPDGNGARSVLYRQHADGIIRDNERYGFTHRLLKVFPERVFITIKRKEVPAHTFPAETRAFYSASFSSVLLAANSILFK